MEGVTVKFVAEQGGGQATGDIRRVKMDWPVSYETLALVAARLFGVPAVKFRYVDDEGDRIVVSSQYELDSALFLRGGGAAAPLRLHTELFQANADVAAAATIDYAGATILGADQPLSPCSNVSDELSGDEDDEDTSDESDEEDEDDDDDEDQSNPAVALFRELVRGSQDAQTTTHDMQSMGRFLRVLGEALVVGSHDVHSILVSRSVQPENAANAVLPPPPPPPPPSPPPAAAGCQVPAALHATDMEEYLLRELFGIGFTDTETNLRLLRSSNNDMDSTIKALLAKREDQ